MAFLEVEYIMMSTAVPTDDGYASPDLNSYPGVYPGVLSLEETGEIHLSVGLNVKDSYGII